MNPRSHCRTSILEEEFKFKYVRRDMYIHIATQNNKSGTLPGNVNMEVSLNIWNRNTFQTTILYALGVYRQFEKRKIFN